MTTRKMYTVSRTHDSRKPKALLICPHGDAGESFLPLFPEYTDALDERLLRRYLAIEQDKGAKELTYKIAESVDAIVITMDYPRGLLDGGRVLEHCIRDVLPEEIMDKLKDRLLAIHQHTLHQLNELYAEINEADGLMLDIHTMASFNPKGGTFPILPDNMEAYMSQFCEAPRHVENLRVFDLITSDDEGHLLADEGLANRMREQLAKAGISYEENKPYAASKHYLMYPNLKKARGICFDVPKHMLSPLHKQPEDFLLESFTLDPRQVEAFADLVIGAVCTVI